jgi:hypothetical protein
LQITPDYCINLQEEKLKKIYLITAFANNSRLLHSFTGGEAEENYLIDLNWSFYEWYWQDLYAHVGWPLYKKYGHAFEVIFLCSACDVIIGKDSAGLLVSIIALVIDGQ